MDIYFGNKKVIMKCVLKIKGSHSKLNNEIIKLNYKFKKDLMIEQTFTVSFELLIPVLVMCF